MNMLVSEICSFWNHCRYRALVTVDERRIVEVARTLAEKTPTTPEWKDEGVAPQNDRASISYDFYMSAVNYCYVNPRKPSEQFTVGKFTGSRALCHCFYREFGEREIQADQILEICKTPERFARFAKGDVPLPLMEHRREFLHEAATVLKEKYAGDPTEIFRTASYRIVGKEGQSYPGILTQLLTNFPTAFGGDRAPRGTGSLPLVFAKRAQLWPLVYQGRALASDLPLIQDPENIGPIIDYHVINALRFHGITIYDPILASIIDSRESLARHGDGELALRLSAVYAVVKLLAEINRALPESRPPWTMVELDFFLWTMGREAKKAHPHVLCSTTDY